MRLLRTTWLGLLLASFALPVCAQEASVATETEKETPAVATKELPSGDKVLDDFIEATGGKEAMKSIKSVRSTGTMKIPTLGLTGPMSVLQKSPGKFKTVIEIVGIGEIVQTVNKDKAWSIDPTQGARLLDGEELESALKEADFQSSLNRQKYYKKIECVDRVDLDGKPAWKVELTKKSGKVETSYYDVNSKLLVMTESVTPTPLGDIDVKANMLDYKKIGKFLTPTKVVVEVPPQLGGSRVIEITKVEYNKDIEDAEFDMPEEVQELVE
ncbi:MAG: hypothetical protein AAF497_00285 [Planctomycetota bacterium]